jgi:hypothetical protein
VTRRRSGESQFSWGKVAHWPQRHQSDYPTQRGELSDHCQTTEVASQGEEQRRRLHKTQKDRGQVNLTSPMPRSHPNSLCSNPKEDPTAWLHLQRAPQGWKRQKSAQSDHLQSVSCRSDQAHTRPEPLQWFLYIWNAYCTSP